MPTPIEFLTAQSAATRQLIESLSDADMARESAGCPGWTVKDVVVHLTSAAEMFDLLAKGKLNGDRWMEERQQRMASNAGLPDADLRRKYAETDQTLLSTFQGLSPEELQSKRTHPVLGEIPVQHFIGMRTSETAVHGWDVQATLDPNAKLQSPALAGVLPAVVGAWPNWFVPDKIAGITRTYRFHIGEPMNHDHTLRITDGKAAWTEDGTPGDATISLEAGDFMLLISGRLSSEKLISSGRAQASGDVAAAKELSTLFKAYAGR